VCEACFGVAVCDWVCDWGRWIEALLHSGIALHSACPASERAVDEARGRERVEDISMGMG